VHLAFSASETSVVDAFLPRGRNSRTAARTPALKRDGTMVAWGCGANTELGQCSAPSRLTGVTAIAADAAHSLALAGPMTPAPCKVPEVVGKRFASAKLTIA
jgi:hypothetical protein